MINQSKIPSSSIPLGRPQGVHDNTVGATQWRLQISFPAPVLQRQSFKVAITSIANPRGTRPRGYRFVFHFPHQCL
jgi:hypothetical protein